MAANLTAVGIFAVSFWLRWIGGELVFVHSMGVKPPPATSRQAAAGSQRRIA